MYTLYVWYRCIVHICHIFLCLCLHGYKFVCVYVYVICSSDITIYLLFANPEGQECFLEKINEVLLIPKVTAYYLQGAVYGGSS